MIEILPIYYFRILQMFLFGEAQKNYIILYLDKRLPGKSLFKNVMRRELAFILTLYIFV